MECVGVACGVLMLIWFFVIIIVIPAFHGYDKE